MHVHLHEDELSNAGESPRSANTYKLHLLLVKDWRLSVDT